VLWGCGGVVHGIPVSSRIPILIRSLTQKFHFYFTYPTNAANISGLAVAMIVLYRDHVLVLVTSSDCIYVGSTMILR
jgi:hypothetical protein